MLIWMQKYIEFQLTHYEIPQLSPRYQTPSQEFPDLGRCPRPGGIYQTGGADLGEHGVCVLARGRVSKGVEEFWDKVVFFNPSRNPFFTFFVLVKPKWLVDLT